MIRYLKDFPEQLAGFDFNTLESSKDSIYGLTDKLSFSYFNPAFFEFGHQNHLSQAIIYNPPLDVSLNTLIKGKEIKEYYEKLYNRSLQTGKVLQHDYECSSATEYRHNHMEIFPLKNGAGLIVVNRIKISVPINILDRKSKKPEKSIYTQPSGYIVQCSNCRHFQRSDQTEIWDWIPDWINHQPDNSNHSICPVCFDYYWKHNKIKHSGRFLH